MPPTLTLPRLDGTLAPYTLSGRAPVTAPPGPITSRVGMAAVHVVANLLAHANPTLDAAVDWDATLRFRHHIWSLGLAVAEAMDTSQRGMGFEWVSAKELIKRSVAEARTVPGAVLASGAGTDHLAPGPRVTIADVEAAYEEQCAFIEGCGGRIILMASRALAACAKSPDDYVKVYGRILSQVREPVIIHWLGEMFDPALEGYWGKKDHHAAMEVCLSVISRNQGKVDGIKVSLLDKDKEVVMRRKLPKGVRMYTGDDFNFAELIEGDAQGYSDALLGIFDSIAPAASQALSFLSADRKAEYHEVLAPTVPLSRHIFKAPTRFYKTGVVFLAWLNGQQDHFMMIGGQESARSLVHLAELFRLADKARVLHDPDLAASRMTKLLAVHGLA